MQKNRQKKLFYCILIKTMVADRLFCAIRPEFCAGGLRDGYPFSKESREKAKKTRKTAIFFFTFRAPCAIIVRQPPRHRVLGEDLRTAGVRQPITQTAGQAEESRAQVGFLGRRSADAAENSLKIQASIPCGIFLASTNRRSAKTASHLCEGFFRGIFGAEDAALLTQGKDDKPKSAEKGRAQTTRVRLSSA